MSGTFDADREAHGRLSYVTPGCASEEIAWTATTTGPQPAPPPPPPPPAQPPPPGPDAAPPVASALAVRGGTISYRLSEAARVAFKLDRLRGGRRVGGRCVTPRRSNARARACTRYVRLAGSRTHAGVTGPNAVVFGNRWSGARLPDGRYRLTAVATDRSEKVGSAVRLTFTIRR